MSGWLRAVARELRQLTCVLAVVAMALVVGLTLWSKGADWGARWNELGRSLRDYMIILAPISVVLGVWQGGRLRRDDVGELLASTRRATLARGSSEVVALGLALWIGLLLGAASAAWTIVLVGGWGTWAAAAYVVGTAPVLLAWAALGHVVGRLVPWRVAAPIAGVLTYLLLGFVVYDSDSLAVVMGGGWLGGVDDFAFDTDGWVLCSVLALVAAAALVGAGSLERRPSAGRAAAALTAVAALTAAVLAAPAEASVDSGRTDYPMADVPTVCTKDEPTVCVSAPDQHLLPQVTAQARRWLARLRGIPGAPTSAGPVPADASMVTVLPVDGGSTTPWGKPDTRYGPANYVQSYLLFNPDLCTDFDQERSRLPDDPGATAFQGWMVLDSWLRRDDLASEYAENEGQDPVAVIARRFVASTDAQRRDYAGRLLAAARACDAGAARAAVEALAR